MARKQYVRIMMTSRWMRWALLHSILRFIPRLQRSFNCPIREIRATAVANTVWESKTENISINVSDELYEKVLLPSMSVDGGDTSKYPEKYSILELEFVSVDDCVVYGRTMRLVHSPSFCALGQRNGWLNWNYAKPMLGTYAEPGAELGHCIVLSSRGHYYHFFADDILPAIYFLKRYGSGIGKISIIARVDYPPFVRDTLDAIVHEFPFVEAVYISSKDKLAGVAGLYQWRAAAAAEWMPVSSTEAQFLRGLLLTHYRLKPKQADRRKRILVSRKGARLRRLKNENELADALISRGFDVFVPDASNHPMQIETFMQANVVVAVHGAALTNFLFCEPGTKIVELFPSDHIKSPYLWLSSQLGLKYQAVTGSKGDYLQGFSVEIDDVLRAV